MSGIPVFVALTSFGSDFVKQKGQAYFLRDIASAGLAGAEIRRELFTSLPASFEDIRKCAATYGLRLIYSTPISLFAADGWLATDNLRLVGREAAALGAEAVKFFLGPVTADFLRSELLDTIAEFSPIRLLVENDQTPTGGTIAASKPSSVWLMVCRWIWPSILATGPSLATASSPPLRRLGATSPTSTARV